MAITKRGKYSYGENQSDLRQDMAVYSEMNKYPIDHYVDAGKLAKLPLASESYMHIDNGLYFWPEFQNRKTVGSVLNPAAPKSSSKRPPKRPRAVTKLDL